MDDKTNYIDLKKYRKTKSKVKQEDAEAEKLWQFTGKIEEVILEGLKETPSVQITGVMANRLGEMIRYVRAEIGIDITEQILEMVRKYSK